jgi:LemA protein
MEMIILLVVVAVLAFWLVAIYNQLVALKNRQENGFSQIEVQLKRRYDLIPNLVETAKAYMAHVVMEAYPDLKANQNMMQLTEELTSTENKVAFARQAFNDQVTEYNTYRSSFPPVMVAATFGHPNDAQLLEFEDSAAIQAAPKISF